MRLALCLSLLVLVPSAASGAPLCASRGRAMACRLDDGTVAVRVGQGPWMAHRPRVLPEIPPLIVPSVDVAEPEVVPDGPVVIDILVVGTSASVAAQGGPDAFAAFAQLAIDITNQTILNTAIPGIQVRLVGVREWAYAETNLSSDLTAVTINASVAGWRTETGADQVSLISESADACGIGYLTASAGLAFTAVNRGCAVGNLSFPHELGHNIGMQHDRGSATSAPAYPYSYGYIAPDCSFRDVMSYPICAPRLNHYSSPRIVINGQPAGTATEDNDLTLRNRAATVAAFRAPASTTAPRPTSNLRAL